MSTIFETSGSHFETDLPVIPARRAAHCPLAPPPQFAAWREEPGLRRAMFQGNPIWVVSRYKDIRAALVDPRLSAKTIPDAIMPTDADNNVPVMFARTDDPEHHRLRRMMTSNFTFRRCESMRPQIQDTVDHYLGEMVDNGAPADLVREFALPVMRERRYGRILNTCSAAGILGAERMSNYGAAKSGLVGFTRVLAAEGAEHNIKVNAIAPIAYTRMLAHSVDGAGLPDDPSARGVLDHLVGQYLQRLDPALVAPVAPSWYTGTARFPARSIRLAPGTLRGFSSAGQGVSTVRG
jgi:NAD(P)-dependent dehydrogenase (short-subunit alcohol dehydrogenase family)